MYTVVTVGISITQFNIEKLICSLCTPLQFSFVGKLHILTCYWLNLLVIDWTYLLLTELTCYWQNVLVIDRTNLLLTSNFLVIDWTYLLLTHHHHPCNWSLRRLMKTPLLPGEGVYMEVGDVQGPVGNDRQGVQVNSVGPLSPLLCNSNNMIKITQPPYSHL